MTCDAIRALIQERLDTRLDMRERGRLEVHLLECEACRAYEADMARLHRMLAPEPGAAPAALMERLGLADPPSAPKRRLPRWAWGAAAGFVAAVGLGLAQLSPPDGPVVAEAPPEAVLTWLEPESGSNEVPLPSDALFAEPE